MPRSRKLSTQYLLILFPWLLLNGCGGGGDGTTAPTPISTPVASPAPAALQGTWSTTLAGSAEKVTLTLGATSYQITRPPNQASGTISVTSDRIDFSASSVCSGTGPYRWSITGSSLTFTAISTDACPGRSEVIAGYTYTKSG